MKKILTIELSGDWVLTRREDEKLPITRLSDYIHQNYSSGVSDKEASLTDLKLIVECDKVSVEELKNKVAEFFSATYDISEPGEVLTSKDEDFNESPREKEQADEEAELEDLFGKIEETELDGVLKRVNSLVGADEFKSLIDEICYITPQLIESGCLDILDFRSYIFSINSGYGLSTYLKLFAETLAALGVQISADRVYEEKLGAYEVSDKPFEGVMQLLNNVGTSRKSVICIDVSEWMNHLNEACFKDFIRELERRTERLYIFFRVPFVDKDVLLNIKSALNDVMFIRELSFPPLTGAEVKACAEAELESYGFVMSKAAWGAFNQRISEEKSDGRFYGINTVKKVVRELIYNKQLDNAKRNKADVRITKSDAAMLVAGEINDLSGYEMLSRLVGCEKVRKTVDEILAQIEVSLSEPKSKRPCLHMRFVGNPGTGKTTVARIIGKILKEKGVLSVGNFFEYSGRDFCGRYIGETAPKTAGMCRDAYGSVLFIDEAYSLYRGDGNDRDYGKEALDTLIAEMENHRSDFVVIMAGYTDEMELLMKGNAGLSSRMPYTIEFPNFTKQQLYEIFCSMVDEQFEAGDGLKEAAHEYFLGLSDDFVGDKKFSNARFVRNLFERTWAKAAMRCQLEKKKLTELTRDDFMRSISDKEFELNQKKKTAKIGFSV